MVYVFLCLTEGFKQGVKGFIRHREGVQGWHDFPKDRALSVWFSLYSECLEQSWPRHSCLVTLC